MSLELERIGRFVVAKNLPQPLIISIAASFKFFSKKYNLFSRKLSLNQESLFRIHDGKLIFPIGLLIRFLYILKKKNYKVDLKSVLAQLNLPTFIIDKSKLNVELRQFQVECLSKIATYLRLGLGGFVACPPAFGKTFLIAVLAYLLSNRKIDIVTRRRDLALSIYNQMLKFMANVGICTSGMKEKRNITIYTARSLGHSSFDAELVILDEVHELVTDLIFEQLMQYHDAVMLGFTATPDTRFDNLHRRIEALCGPVIYAQSYNELVKRGFVVPIAVKWFLVTGADEIDDSNDISLKRTGIWRNSKRNALIAAIAKDFVAQQKQVLILVDTIEHVYQLKQFLPDWPLYYIGNRTFEGEIPNDIDYVRLNQEERSRLFRAFAERKILGIISTKVWSTGVSFDGLDCVIRADGGASDTASIQIPGRVSRIFPEGSKEFGIVCDFEDAFHDRLLRQSQRRMRAYLEYGWTQILPDGRIRNPAGTTSSGEFLSDLRMP